MTVESVNSPTIVQNAPFVLSIKIVPGHVSDRSWDRKRLIEARMAAGIDKKAAIVEYNAALDAHRSTMKAQVAAILSKSDAVVTRIRNLKSGALTVTVENHENKRIAAEQKLQSRIDKLIAERDALKAAK